VFTELSIIFCIEKSLAGKRLLLRGKKSAKKSAKNSQKIRKKIRKKSTKKFAKNCKKAAKKIAKNPQDVFQVEGKTRHHPSVAG
jgi:hypothetical protein